MKKTILSVLVIATILVQLPLAYAGQPQDAIAALSSSNRQTRMDAVRELDRSQYRNNPDIVEPLIRAMRSDSDFLVREYSADALADHRDARALPAVIETLQGSQYSNAHRAAAYALRRSSDERAKPALLQALSSTENDVRRYSATALGNFVRDANVVDALKNSLKSDSNSLVREYAGESLVRLPAAQAIAIFNDVIQTSTASGRAEAVKGLAQVRDSAAVQPLINVVGDRNRDVRRAAARGLSSYATRADVFEALYARFALESDNYNKEIMFENLMKNSDARALELARNNIASSNSSIQRESLRKLKQSGDKHDLERLVGLLNSSDEFKRRDAYDAIRAIIGRLSQNDPLRNQIAGCLPTTTEHEYSRSTRETALLMDIFLGGMGLFTATAHGKHRVVNRLSNEQVRALQALIHEMVG